MGVVLECMLVRSVCLVTRALVRIGAVLCACRVQTQHASEVGAQQFLWVCPVLLQEGQPAVL